MSLLLFLSEFYQIARLSDCLSVLLALLASFLETKYLTLRVYWMFRK